MSKQKLKIRAHSELDKVTNKKDHNVTDHLDSTIIIEKRFRAPVTDYYLNMYQNREKFKHDILNNLDFYLRFYFPKNLMIKTLDKPHKDTLHVIIMLNGLNEILPSHYRLYDRLGASFANYGIVSILMPTPFHLCRTPKQKRHEEGETIKETLKVPSDALLENPFYLPNNFVQTLHETNLLINLLKRNYKITKQDTDAVIKTPTKDDKYFYDLFFKNVAVEVSILGYSLGGLKALSCFKNNPDVFKHCVILNSGGTLFNLNIDLEFPKGKTWKDDIVKPISPLHPRITKESNMYNEFVFFNDSKYQSTIHSILFDEKNVFDDLKFDKHVGKLILIAGGKDRLVEPDSIKRLKTSEHGLNVLQIADLGHFIEQDPQFNRWYGRIIDLLIVFFHETEGQLISANASLALFSILDICHNTKLSKHVKASKKLEGLPDILECKEKNCQELFRLTVRSIYAHFKTIDRFVERFHKFKKKMGLFFGQIAEGHTPNKHPKLEDLIIKTDKHGLLKLSGEKLKDKKIIGDPQIELILEEQIILYKAMIDIDGTLLRDMKNNLKSLLERNRIRHL